MSWTLDDILASSERSFVKKGDSYILVNNETNEQLVDIVFDDVIEDGWEIWQVSFFVKKDSKWGVFNISTLEFERECNLDAIKLIHDDEGKFLYYQTIKDDKFGVNFTIEPEYDKIELYDIFSYLVYKGDLCGLYVRDELILPAEFQSIVKADKGYIVQREGLYGFYTHAGDLIIPCEYDEIVEVYASVLQLNKKGCISYHLDPEHKQYVDLGLSVKWGVCNLPGKYSFGSIKPADEKEWEDKNNPYVSEDHKLLKYNNCSALGHMDGLTRLLPEDDAATVLLGEKWRIPTFEEIKELHDLCKCEKSYNDEVIVTGPSGQSIALKRELWCNRYHTSDVIPASDSSHDFGLHASGIFINDSCSRLAYKFIRPVYDENYSFEKPVVPSFDFDSINIETEGFVDLGLSVKWSTVNLGADTPEVLGNYYSWGSICPKERPKGNNSYASNCKTEVNFEKYNFDDNLSRLEPADDAATHVLGPGFRMPTVDEMSELHTKCYWIDYKYNGVDGYKVVGPSGKAIFIPTGALWTSDASDGQRLSLNKAPVPIRDWAWALCGCIAVDTADRGALLNIRPVLEKNS